MLRNLLTPEAHRDPYVWAAVFFAHLGIGLVLFVIGETLMAGIRPEHYDVVPLAFGGAFSVAALGLVVYAGFEAVQAIVSRSPRLWDSVLDWVAVAIGVLIGAHLVAANPLPALFLSISAVIIAAIGSDARTGD